MAKRPTEPPVGTRVPNLLPDGRQGVDSAAEQNAGKQSEAPLESSPLTQGDVDTQPKTVPPTLSLHCRMCDAPPAVTTQPTITTCGHLFCSEYVSRILCSVVLRLTLTPRQVHNTARSVYVQMSRVQQLPLVVLFV